MYVELLCKSPDRGLDQDCIFVVVLEIRRKHHGEYQEVGVEVVLET